MNKEIIHQTTAESLSGKMKFPEVVRLLAETGVESYDINLVQNLKTFYMPSGETHSEKFPFQGSQAPAKTFSAEKVVAAIRSSQKGEITYTQFLDLILEAGVTDYTVYITGRKAIYFGRMGDMHIENFPSK